MSRWKTAAVVAHLALVIASAVGLPCFTGTAVDEVIAAYGHMSGADNRYGFFAPRVPDEIRVRFEIVEARGERRSAELLEGLEGEAKFRVMTLIDRMRGTEGDARAAVAASFAATVLGWHPEAHAVEVIVEYLPIPSMVEWRDGVRSDWIESYRARFERNAAEKRAVS